MIKKFEYYRVLESYSKPEPKYPVNYKCLDIVTASFEIEHKYNINLYEIDAPGSKYGRMNFYSWCSDNLKPIYPKNNPVDIYYEIEKKRFKGPKEFLPNKYPRFERYAVYEIPKYYDATGDEIIWSIKKDNFFKKMSDLMKFGGKKFNPEDYEKNVDFGPKSNNWINIALDAFYNLYSEHYIDGKLRIWEDDDKYDRGKQIYDYPLDKAIYLSDLEKWITEFDMNVNGFYEWILNCQSIEGRYWERSWTYGMEDLNFRKIEAKENIKQINELLRQIYKKEELDIYIDYYKEVDKKIF